MKILAYDEHVLTNTGVDAVEDKADAAQSTADTAQSTADTAQNTATVAKSTADTAKSTAETAEAKADAAQASADAAAAAASAAQASATSAAEAAQTAWDHADDANDAATAAQSSADAASAAAAVADSKAIAAASAASAAQSSANAAQSAADAAQSSADDAMESATIANKAANGALTQLSVVEDVAGVLQWIADHGTYAATTDTEVVPGKFYFTRSGSSPNYTYTVVTNPTGNPKTKGYYELDSVDEAVSNYVSSHLSLTNQGLWVINDNSSYKILLASDGMKVYDAQGILVSTFGESITFSSTRPQTIGNASQYVKFYKDGSTWKIAIVADSISLGSSSVATTGDIPTKVSELDNDSNYSTQTELTDAIDAIEVGGRNLLTGTAESISKVTTETAGYVTRSLYYTPNQVMLSDLGLKVGDEVTLSFDWEVTNASVYGNARIEWYGYKSDSAPDGYIVALVNPFATFSASNTSGHFVKTVKLTAATIKAKRILLRIDNSNLTLTISNCKLEKGNKNTDWTPAPEDVDGRIDTLETFKSEFTVTPSSIISSVAAHESSISSLGTRMSSAESNITQNANGIKAEVKARESATNILWDTDVPSTTKVNSECDRYFSDSGNTSITCSIVDITDAPETGLNYAYRAVCDGTQTAKKGRGLAFYSTNTAQAFTALPLKVGTKYTATWWARCTSGTGGTYLWYRYKENKGRGTALETDNLTSVWKQFTATVELESLPTDYNRIWFYAYFPASTAGTVELCGFRLVAGDNVESYSSTIEQTADRISMVVDGTSTSSSLVLTDEAIEAVTDKLVITGSDGAVVIQNGEIQAKSLAIGNFDQTTQTKIGNGDSALTKVNYYSRSCQVGNSSNSQTKYWRKFASLTTTATNYDPYIIFDVMQSGDFNSSKRFGRLKAHFRTSGTKGVIDANQTFLEWISRGEGILLDEFVLAYKATSGTDVKVELWCKCPTNWQGYRFSMVEEGNRIAVASQALWTMYDSWSADGVASITSGYTQVVSTDIDSARLSAENYITADSSGIKVHNAGDSSNYAHITSNGMDVYKSGNSVASFGSSVRLGLESDNHVALDGDSMEFSDGTNGTYFGIEGEAVSATTSSVSLYSNPLDYHFTDAKSARGAIIRLDNNYGTNASDIYIRAGGFSSDTASSRTASIWISAAYYNSEDYEWLGNVLLLYPNNLRYLAPTATGSKTVFEITRSHVYINGDFTINETDVTPSALFAPTSHTLLSAVSVAANGYTASTKTFTKSGYRPLGIVGHAVSGTGSSFCIPYQLRLSSISDGSATVNYGVRNFNSSAATLTMTVDILWAKII